MQPQVHQDNQELKEEPERSAQHSEQIQRESSQEKSGKIESEAESAKAETARPQPIDQSVASQRKTWRRISILGLAHFFSGGNPTNERKTMWIQ